jgi:hypothetical protein
MGNDVDTNEPRTRTSYCEPNESKTTNELAGGVD